MDISDMGIDPAGSGEDPRPTIVGSTEEEEA
jgi:hypothetical protein